jgi:O-6-methylguanine DNA methyltransferase
VPRGAVTSYQALGAYVEVPKGARAVGNALHNNPVAIYVLCHRVISADDASVDRRAALRANCCCCAARALRWIASERVFPTMWSGAISGP